ncbi:MAG: hypothetical protein GKC53_05060 [Neisseriaceae bacterium]|nr:MAG: hypothetical protein GKC53_05060 [Neisseriaceae bacterium]
MKNNLLKEIVIYHSIPKILVGLIKPFVILILTCILLLHPNLENYYYNISIMSIGLMIIVICFYHFFQAINAIIKNQKNYLVMNSNGLVLYSDSAPNFQVKWQDIQAMHSIINFDKFVFETDLFFPVNKIGKYEIMYPTKSLNKNSSYCNIVVSGKYLNIHIKELEYILETNIPKKTNIGH